MASSGVQTIGSLSLNEVFKTTGRARLFAERFDQIVITLVHLALDGLHAPRAIDVRGPQGFPDACLRALYRLST